MENLPEIKWHFQRLVKFFKQDQNNPMFATLCNEMEAMLNSYPLKPIDAVADLHEEDD